MRLASHELGGNLPPDISFFRSPRLLRGIGTAALAVAASAALAPAAFGQTFDGPSDRGIAGVELTSEHGFYLGMLEAGDSLTLVHEEDKTAFVGVKGANEGRIRMCAYVSKWEAKKFDVKIQDYDPDNPCTEEEMNELKNRYSFGEDFNCRDCIDGKFVSEDKIEPYSSTCDDPYLYRNYDPSNASPLNLDPSFKQGFDTPLIVNGKRVELSGPVYYRWIEKYDGKAVNVRIKEDSIPGLSSSERRQLNQWFLVKAGCLPPDITDERGGPKKKPGARRGKRPNLNLKASAVKRNTPSEES